MGETKSVIHKAIEYLTFESFLEAIAGAEALRLNYGTLRNVDQYDNPRYVIILYIENED